MTHKWMLGTAVAAVLVATPALAQTSEFRECAIEEWTEEEFLGIDIEEPGLTMDEYRDCLEEAGIELDEEQTAAFEGAFEDADADAVLVWAEVEAYQQEQQAAAGGEQQIGEPGRPQGSVTVTQPAAEVVVQQPAPEVTVEQPEPDVAVTTPAPEVDVEARRPEVEVTQAQPEVEVEQEQPTVQVQQPDPEVAVRQPEPQVQVEAGQPAVEVETGRPDVEVEETTPEVAVQQPELDVDVEQENPEVAVRQGQPEVEIEETGEVEVETAQTETGIVETETEVEAAGATAEYRIAVSELEGQEVMNAAGEEIGEIERILLDPGANTPVVILSVGGVFGIGAREVAFPYDDLSVSGDTVVLNTDMTEDQIREMPEYDENAYQELPETMRVE